MQKVLILGSSGMLGHVVYEYLKETKKYTTLSVSFSQKVNDSTVLIDVTDKIALEQYIKFERPDIVINCVGILIKGSNNDHSNAIYINSYLPHQLVKLMREIGGKLIHISTDCVFSGKKGNYIETDFKDADDMYGRSKSLGEIINDHDLTLRTSIIGPELKTNGEGLFHWFMQQQDLEIKGFSKVFWSGVTTLELAKVIDAAIEQELTGLINITNGNKISKYELLQLFKHIFYKNRVEIIESTDKESDKSLVSKRNDFSYTFPSYSSMIKTQFDYMNKHIELYSSFYNF
jgi:dTDP-4-dehydrorhamnose reductase